MNEDLEKERLKDELDRAYSQLGEITSRLLAVNEAADLFASSYDASEIASNLLEVSCRTFGATSGIVYQVVGEGDFSMLAQLGLDDTAVEELSANLVDIAACNLVQNEARSMDIQEILESESFQEWAAEHRESDPEANLDPQFQLYVPMGVEETVLGILALGQRSGPVATYPPEERLFAEHLAGQGTLALDRGLLFANNEDRIKDLDALLRIGRELTSTLDLDNVMLTAVNTTAAIVDRERAILALYKGGKLELRAVSEFPRVDSSTAERLGLVRLLEWLSLRKIETLNVNASDVEENAEIEGREVLQEYFSRDMRALLVIGLNDDQGPIGVLIFESFREESFSQSHDREALTVLAGQLSVSIRNAELYRQLPMVSALGPLAERRRRWERLSPGQRGRTLAIAVALLALIAVIPWPRSVAGDARVLPAVEVPVRAASEGILTSVEVSPGDRVSRGQLLARLDPVPAGARLAELRAEAELARSDLAEAEVARDPVRRRQAELRHQQALARMVAARTAEGRADLVAPADGFVLTPDLTGLEGSFLEAGDIFCQVSPLDSLLVEVAISEADIHSVRPGQELRIKVLGFPDKQFRGRVHSVAWQGEQDRPGQESSFLVRGWVRNPGPSLRSGMTGRARIAVQPATILWRSTRGFMRALRLWLWI